jgi:hypothetical protein
MQSAGAASIMVNKTPWKMWQCAKNACTSADKQLVTFGETASCNQLEQPASCQQDIV